MVVDDRPEGTDPWLCENHQRNAAVSGLLAAQSSDGIILSDADEIPSADAVRRWTAQMGTRGFEQICSYYWINCIGGGWVGSRILSFRDPRAFRNAAAVRHAQFLLLPNGGWHFIFMSVGWETAPR